MKKILFFLLLTFSLSAQNVSFSVGEILIMDSNRNMQSHIFLKEGVLKVNLKSKYLIYKTDSRKTKLRILAHTKSDHNSIVIQTAQGYSFVIFEDFFVMRKLFKFENHFIFVEQRLYTIIKHI